MPGVVFPAARADVEAALDVSGADTEAVKLFAFSVSLTNSD